MVVLEYVELQEPTNGNQSKIDAFQLNPSGYRTPQKYYCSSNDSAEHFTSIPADQQKIQKKTSTRIHRHARLCRKNHDLSTSWPNLILKSCHPPVAATPRPQFPAPRSPPPARCGWGDPAPAGGCSERPSCTDDHAAMAGTAAPWSHGKLDFDQ